MFCAFPVPSFLHPFQSFIVCLFFLSPRMVCMSFRFSFPSFPIFSPFLPLKWRLGRFVRFVHRCLAPHHTHCYRNYPPLAAPSPLAPGQLRASAHTDYGVLTILRSTEPGLQVQTRAGAWWISPPLPSPPLPSITPPRPRRAWDCGRMYVEMDRRTGR